MFALQVILAYLAPSLILPAPPTEVDTDRDGLSDVHEVHKYGTDPKKKDSDGDGVPDGDWLERREYAYTVRSVVQVMWPVTLESLSDDYQDVRVLDEAQGHVELEVIHYPFCTIGEALGSKKTPHKLKRWLEPGPTSNCSAELGRAIAEAMLAGDEKLPDVDTKEGVVQAARWLLKRAQFHSGFTSFVTAFDEQGHPFVPEVFLEIAKRNAERSGWSIEEQWSREVLAAGMFEHKSRGSCTSSAIYLSGCLRALGVPTRTVLCIPIIDASDENEWRLLDIGITHHGVRDAIHAALDGNHQAWTSHTFNEVYVQGRWRRLNYSKLDQGILDEQFLGLMTHVGTFHDWADARFWETVGLRQKSDMGPDVFGYRNPYSTISLRDQFGEHCQVANPELPANMFEVAALHWTDASSLPPDILESNSQRARFGLIAEVLVPSNNAWRRFIGKTDKQVWLEADGNEKVEATFQAGCWWYKDDRAFIYLALNQDGPRSLKKGVTYRAVARNNNDRARWKLKLDVQRD